jgi:hypothetical protein
MGSTSDTAAQLMQLGEAESFRVLDQHYRGISNVDPDFDDRR